MFQSAPGAVARRKHLAASGCVSIIECFNPLPAQWPGESHRGHDQRLVRCGFNPLPAQWPGESPRSGPALSGPAGFQSAPGAVARRKPLVLPHPSCHRSRFNPLPAQWPGESMDDEPTPPGTATRFNPLPAQWPGESSLTLKQREGLAWFQSAPGAVARRKPDIVARYFKIEAFQSAPGAVARRKPPTGPRQRHICFRFNPLPAQWPGESVFEGIAVNAQRHCFNPLPAQWPGESPRVFQRRSLDCRCFNPLPAQWPGESMEAPQGGDQVSCFNPLPAQWPGESSPKRSVPKTTWLFQSAPGAVARRKPHARICGLDRTGFNPLPAQWPGESTWLIEMQGTRPVSIRSRRSGQEKAGPDEEQPDWRKVSIRSRRSGQEKAPDTSFPLS